MQQDRFKHDWKMTITVVSAIAVHGFGTVWWASDISRRVSVAEDKIKTAEISIIDLKRAQNDINILLADIKSQVLYTNKTLDKLERKIEK